MSIDWLLELGHTRLKVAALSGAAPGMRSGQAEALAPRAFEDWLRAHVAPDDRCWLAAVPDDAAVERLTRALDRNGRGWRRIRTGEVGLPVAPAYPGLGVDRWLAMQPPAAEGGAFCVVDCGSATTLDLVGADGIHRGGWIVPGVETAREGLLMRAPVLRRPRPAPAGSVAPARDTAEAIEHGLLLQQLGTIVLALEQAQAVLETGTPRLLITGGAAGPVQSRLEALRPGVAQWRPDLVLHGLAMAVRTLEAA